MDLILFFAIMFGTFVLIVISIKFYKKIYRKGYSNGVFYTNNMWKTEMDKLIKELREARNAKT